MMWCSIITEFLTELRCILRHGAEIEVTLCKLQQSSLTCLSHIIADKVAGGTRIAKLIVNLGVKSTSNSKDLVHANTTLLSL